jgi:hypothetical protein
MKKNVYNVCIGLMIGTFFPFTLILILWVAEGIVAIIAYRYFHVNVRPNEVELFILLIPMEMIGFFFLARFNRTLAAAALVAATGVMLLLLSIITYL